MSRVLILGYGPLPGPGQRHAPGPSLRTAQVFKIAAEDGHTVNAFTLPSPGVENRDDAVAQMEPAQFEGVHYQQITKHDPDFVIGTLNEQVRQLGPDAIIGVNTYASYLASKLETTIPLWCDLNGSYMAEMQARCWAEGDDTRLLDAWKIQRAILRRLDKFSAVSRAQLHAVLGELAGVGRMNRHTFNFAFGNHMANATHRWQAADPPASDKPILRGPLIPEDAFIILWSGGFSLSVDYASMVQAMNDLMGLHEQVHMAVTGGPLEGVDTRTYAKFEELVEASPHKGRFHRLGWLDSEKLPKIYAEADLGINVDSPNYETMFGGRARLTAMASEGMAIVTTIGSEISEWLDDAEAALTAPMGDPHALVEAIEPFLAKREALAAYGKRAKALMEEDFSIAETGAGLRSWLKNPKNAPDNTEKLCQAGGSLRGFHTKSVNGLEAESHLLETYDTRNFMKTKRELDSLRQTPWFRAYQKVRKWLGN